MIGYRALVCGLAAAILGIAPATALTIPFSYKGVTGEVDGLLDNMNGQQATALYIDSVPSRLSQFLPAAPFDALSLSKQVLVNYVDVTNGKITLAFFYATGHLKKPSSDWTLEWCTGESCVFAGKPGLLFSLESTLCSGGCGIHIETPLPPAFPLYLTAIILMAALSYPTLSSPTGLLSFAAGSRSRLSRKFTVPTNGPLEV